MIEKLIICTFSQSIFEILREKLNNVEKIEVRFCDTTILFSNKEFNVINTPTTFMESFGANAKSLDCQIIPTKNKWDLPDYVVTSPNFIIPSRLSKSEMGFYQIEIPLKKVQEYFKDANVKYAIHTEFSFEYFEEINEKLINDVMYLLKKVLYQEIAKNNNLRQDF